jgi:hypothetical protein
MDLIIAGVRWPLASVEGASWLDDPKRAPSVTDGAPRAAHKVRGIVLHTTRGARGGRLRPGGQASTRAEALARYQAQTAREVSWHLTVDTDGTVLQQADLATWMTWHAGHANGWTIGIELVQQADSADLWEAQLAALVAVCDAAAVALAIPRRVLLDAGGAPLLSPVRGLLSPAARSRDGAQLGGRGERWGGAIGHCNLVPSHVRGPGDPGPLPFEALLRAGWQGLAASPDGLLP